MPRFTAASLLLLAPALVSAASCPSVHVFGARETTASPGYGSTASVVTSIVNSYSGATSEVINYPACGGQSSCGGDSYAQSASAGVQAVASQVNSYNQQCPNTVLVLVGYSQGGQIFDDAYCGGGDTNEGITSTAIPISTAAQKKIAAAIFMGDPRRIPGLSYNAGTCQSSGFAPRPSGFQCPYAANIQSYCDYNDEYCCSGTSTAVHNGYAPEYGSAALTFVKGKVNAALGGSTTTAPVSTAPGSTTSPTSTAPSGGCTAAKYAQCGGIGFTGCTTCASGSTCKASNSYYSQCL